MSTTPTDAPPQPAPAEHSTGPIVALAAGRLACASCGVEVAPPHYEVIEAPTQQPGHPGPGMLVRLTRCGSCVVTHLMAAALLETYPRTQHRIGSFSVAQHQVSLALDALAALRALGHRPLALQSLTRSERDLRSLLRHLVIPGGLARWSARLSPVLTEGARPDTAASSAWAHLTPDHPAARELRAGYGALLSTRLGPRPVPHPSGEGCGLCGVDSVSAMPSAPSPWTEIHTSVSSLGGRGAERVTIHACPPCLRHLHEHGVGPVARERSLIEYLGGTVNLWNPPTIDGLVAWAVSGARPSSSRWAHVGDLEEIRERLTQTR